MIEKDFAIVACIGAGIGLFAQAVIENVFPGLNFAPRLAIAAGCVLVSPLALFAARFVEMLVPGAYQFAKFSAVGTLNNAIDFGILNTAMALAGVTSGWLYPIFKAISFSCATVNSFLWNKHWTFRAHGPIRGGEAARFSLFAVGGGILNVAAASVATNVVFGSLGMTGFAWANVGALAGTACALVWDFIAYKYFVFARS